MDQGFVEHYFDTSMAPKWSKHTSRK
jgi:hypothetical protein